MQVQHAIPGPHTVMRLPGKVAMNSRHINGCKPAKATRSPSSSEVMQYLALPAMKKYAATPLPQQREGATRPQQTATKNGPRRGPQEKICPHSETHKPLNRENTCPRWDSN
jgi:hypothetical protein